jgi:hypothetical protein
MPPASGTLLLATFTLLVAGSMAHALASKLKSELAGVSGSASSLRRHPSCTPVSVIRGDARASKGRFPSDRTFMTWGAT